MTSFRIHWRGWVFLALAAAVGYAALHKGSNLLFAVFSTLVGVFLVSALLSALALRRLELERILPPAAHAAQPFSYAVEIRNRKRLLPASGLVVEDVVVSEGRPAPARPAPVTAPVIGPGGRGRATLLATVYQRGWAALSRLTVTAEFPPGLVSFRRTFALEDKILVYPRQGIIDRRVLNPYLARVEFLDLLATSTCAGSEHFAGVRDYRPGDNPRWIHWRLSAKIPHRTLVREFEDARLRYAVILLETFVPNLSDARRLLRLERAVSFSAALADALQAEGYVVRFTASVPEPVEVLVDPRRGSVEELETVLATLRPSRIPSAAEAGADGAASRDAVYFLLRIGADETHPPIALERSLEIHADEMRSMMYYAR